MTRQAPRPARAPDEPRPLAYWFGVVRDRWVVVALVGALVFAWRAYGFLLEQPTYLSQAAVKFDTPRDPGTGLASLWVSESLDSVVSSELLTLRSQRVADLAAKICTLHATIEQRDAWRPLDVARRGLGVGEPLCRLQVETPRLESGQGSRAWVVTFDGAGGAPRLRASDDGAPVAEGRARTEGGHVVTVEGREIVLLPLEGDPKGKRFDLVLRSPEALAAWLRAGSAPSSAGKGSGVAQVGFVAASPYQAQAGAQALADAYKTFRDERARADSHERKQWLDDQAALFRKHVEAAEQKFDDHVAESGALLLGEQAKGIVEDLGRLLTERLAQQQVLAGEREALAELEAAKSPERVLVLLGSAGADSMVSALSEQVASLEVQRGALLRFDVKADHPDAKRLEAQIAEARGQLATQLEAARERALELQRRRVARVEGRIAALEEERANAEKRLAALPAKERASARLERDVRLVSETYEQILKWEKEAELRSVSSAADVTPLDPAHLPQARLAPLLTRSLAVALGLALTLGVAAAVLLHSRDKNVRTPKALEQATGLSLYAAIPAFKTVPSRERRGLRGPLPALDVPDSVITEAYRTLRANLRFAGMETPVHSLAITSAVEQEGKTVTTLNLAIVMAQAGARVVVVDADLRRPSTHKVMDAPLEPGLVQVLSGAVPWEQAVRRHVRSGVDFLHAGGHPPNPGKLLESKAMIDLQAALLTRYDHVLFDVPPVLAAVDAAGLFVRLDGVLLLSRAGRVTDEMADAARERIERVGGKVLGCVFNAYDARRAARRYGYGYGYGYRYGYRADRGAPPSDHARAPGGPPPPEPPEALEA